MRHGDEDIRLRRAAAWWTHDYPPLDGRIRALFYGLMLILGHQAFTHDIPQRVATCPPAWFQPVGLATWFFGAMDPLEVSAWLSRLAPWLTGAWIGAAVGVCGRWPGLVAGGIMLYAWGAHQGCSGTGHVWHLPMMACLILGCLNQPDRYSLDAVLRRRWAWWPFRPAATAGARSGYARKLVLLCAVLVLFSAGVSKVAEAGWHWADGAALTFYLEEFAAPKGSIGQAMHGFILAHPETIRWLSGWTLALELGAPLMLLYPRSRNLFLLQAMVFHLGIYLLMTPRYFPQMAVYTLLIRWGRRAPAEIGGGSRWGTVALAGFPWLLVVLWAVPVLRQREYFPLSHIPMYSTRVTDTRINRTPRAWFHDLDRLQELVRAHAHPDDLPWWTMYELGERFQLVGWQGERIEPCAAGALDRCVNRFLWQKRIVYALLHDLRTTEAAAHGHFPSVQQALAALGPALWADPAHQSLDGLALVWHGIRPTLLATLPSPRRGQSSLFAQTAQAATGARRHRW